MYATILSVIRKGPKNSRYLILTENNEYGSMVAANEKYNLGDYSKIEETIDSNVKNSWLNTYYNWANTKQKILIHLAKYKKEKLGIEANGIWINQDGEEIEYQHILPERYIFENLIHSSFYDSMINSYHKKVESIHPGFKNLNSSQAFAFNFFQPIIDNNLYYVLLENNELKNYRFYSEYEKVNEDETQFDFYIQNDSFNASFEVKYTEDTFGYTDYDSHKEKWDSTYKEKVEKLLGKDVLSPDDFFVNYQIWRNILFTMEKNHHTYFLYPKFRKDDLSPVIERIMETYPELKERVTILYADVFVNKIMTNENFSEALKEHYQEFKRKYLDIL